MTENPVLQVVYQFWPQRIPAGIQCCWLHFSSCLLTYLQGIENIVKISRAISCTNGLMVSLASVITLDLTMPTCIGCRADVVHGGRKVTLMLEWPKVKLLAQWPGALSWWSSTLKWRFLPDAFTSGVKQLWNQSSNLAAVTLAFLF